MSQMVVAPRPSPSAPAARPTEPPRVPEPVRCLVCAGRRRVYLGAGRVRWCPVCGGSGRVGQTERVEAGG